MMAQVGLQKLDSSRNASQASDSGHSAEHSNTGSTGHSRVSADGVGESEASAGGSKGGLSSTANSRRGGLSVPGPEASKQRHAAAMRHAFRQVHVLMTLITFHERTASASNDAFCIVI